MKPASGVGLVVRGTLALVVIRLGDLASLRGALRARRARREQVRFAATITWEAIQRIELCDRPPAIGAILEDAARRLGCDSVEVSCARAGRTLFPAADDEPGRGVADPEPIPAVPSVTFRLTGGRDVPLTVSLQRSLDATLAADIAFRSLQRLALAIARRIEHLRSEQGAGLATLAPPRGRPASSPSAPSRSTERLPPGEPGQATGREVRLDFVPHARRQS